MKGWKYMPFVVLALGAFVFLVPHALGQAVAVAEVSGQVADATGAFVPGAQVKATQTETQFTRSATADALGNYTLVNLPVGPYSLEVRADGFKTFVQSGIILQVGNKVQINVSLQLGAVTENVVVSADATMVETKNTSVAEVIDSRRIIDLPLNGRNAADLVLVFGAASVTAGGGPNDITGSKSFYSSRTISLAGGQANSTNYLLDGGDNNDFFSNVNLPFPFPEALQEFSVETSSVPARNGLHPGGVVNVVTKSGTNTLHGDVFEYLRNGALNARNFFYPTHDLLKRNQFGGDVGGKIIRDKLFFFGGYQGSRIRTVNNPSGPAYVPTPAMLAGDFTARASQPCASSPVALRDPQGGVFPNNQIPTTRFNAASQKLLNYIPTSNDPCGKLLYQIPAPSTEDQEIAKIDYIRSEKHSLFGRYFIVDYRLPAPFDPKNVILTSANPGNWQRAQTITLGDTYTISPNIVNTFHATFTRRRNNRAPDPSQINAQTLGIRMFTYVPNDIRIQMANNGFGVGCGTCAPGFFNVNTWQFANDIDIVHGRHQMAFGVDLIRTGQNTFTGYLQNGNFNFTNSIVGDTLAEFLLGILDNSGTTAFGQSRGQPTAMRETIPSLYAQDTIRLSPRLTLNLGLRWEPMVFPADYFGRGSTLNLANLSSKKVSKVFVSAPAGMLYYGDAGVPKSFTTNRWANFAPRFGLAWNPHGDGRQTVRVGGAFLYDSPMLYYPQRVMSNPPFVNEIDLNTQQAGPFNDPWALYGSNPFPGVTPPPSNATFPTNAFYAIIPDHIRSTYITNWNVSYQRQFGADWMVSASYLGSKTTHLYLSYDLNSPVSLPGATAANESARRPLTLINPTAGAYMGNIAYGDDGGNATYNGLLFSLRHRLSHNFTVLVNYTYSHCISDGDFSGDLRNTPWQNQFDRRSDRGDCNFDVRQIFNASVVATSPVKGKTWAGRLLGSWQIAPMIRYVPTGTPISNGAGSILSGRDNSLTGEGNDRPNVVPGVNPYNADWGPNLYYLNRNAFTQNATGTFGNLGRNVIRYPGAFNFDTSLSRVFHFTERVRLEARAEAFNIINHTNFTAYANNAYGGLTATLSSGTFGQITSAGDPRILQFALKMHF
jgi:hypothetical protein